jgi:hypothetical protein
MTRRLWEKFVCRCIFQKAYPEIKLTTVTGIGTQLMQRITARREIYPRHLHCRYHHHDGAKTGENFRPHQADPDVG